MKKFLYTIIVFLIVQSTMLVENCIAQWEPDLPITNTQTNSLTSFNNAWCIAANENIVHLVWSDNYLFLNREIWYARSTDGGIGYTTFLRLSITSGTSENPSVAISDSIVHLVWADNSDGNWEIYYKRSTNSGSNWETDTRLTNDTAASRFPSIAVSGSNVYVVWRENRNGNLEIYYKLSTDGGANWGDDTRLTNYTSGKMSPSIAVYGSNVHVVWQENRDGNSEIYYKHSTNSGINWGIDTRLTNDTAASLYPSIAVSGSLVHVVWYEIREGNSEIYFKRSTNSGINWDIDTRLTNDPAASLYPSIAVSGSLVHVVWFDYRDNNPEIYYKRSTNSGINWETDTRLTNNTDASFYPSIAVSGSLVHVVWQDYRNLNSWEIFYKRNANGNIVSINNISSEIPSSFSLSQNYPNPFNPVTNIKITVPITSFVNLEIFDLLGKKIETLVNSELKPGTYTVDWLAAKYPSGIYFYKMSAGLFTKTMKMIIVK